MAGDLSGRINVSLQAVAQVLLVCGLGIWLAKKHGLNRQAIAAVSGVNWHVLMPALMFSSIVGAVTPSGLVLLWPMLLVSLLHIVIGAIPALLLGWTVCLPRDMLFFTVMASSLPNCGNLPWLFMPGLIRYFTPADQAAAQIQYVLGLVSVYTVVTILVTLTVPFLFKRAPETLVLPRMQQALQPSNSQREEHHLTNCPVNDADSAMGIGSEAAAAGAEVAHQQQLCMGFLRSSRASSDDTACVLDNSSRPLGTLLQHPQHNQADEQHTSFMQQKNLPQVLPGVHAVKLSVPDAVVLASHSTDSGVGDSVASFEVQDDLDGDVPPAADGPYAHAAVPHLQHMLAAAVDSFASHHNHTQLLQHSRQLFSSFSRSFGHSFSRRLRRSSSLVQLVWSYPSGWHRQRPGQQIRDRAADDDDGRASWCCGCCARQGLLGCFARHISKYYGLFMAHPAVNLPLGATIAGIACAAVGPVRSVLVNDLAPLHWLWLSLVWVGAAAAPLATLQIGAELMQGAPVDNSMHVSKRAQWSATAIAILVKLVLVPLTNIALLHNAGLASLVPADDKVYQLLLLVEAAVPAAVTLLVVCGRVYPDIRPLSKMLFWQYVASLITLPAFLVWFMYMLDL